MKFEGNQTDWSKLSADEKKYQLFLNQKKTLDMFLERGAINQAQYNKSLGDMQEKWVFTNFTM